MIDRLVIGWSDLWQCVDRRSVAGLIAALSQGRNLTGGRVSRGFYWEPNGPLRLRFRSNGRADDFLTSAVIFERYASPRGELRLSGEIHINPTRLLAQVRDQSVDQWFSTCRAGPRGLERNPHDNMLPIDPAAPRRYDYFWCDTAADIADRFMGLVMGALYGDRSHRPARAWLKQAEAYWEFASPAPIRAVDDVVPAIRACAGASEARYERHDDLGLPVLGLHLGRENCSPRLVTYPRDGRIRVEVRYLGNVGRYAPGAGRGDLPHRLRSVADASVRHVNRALHATRGYRHQNILFGFGSLIDLLQRLIRVLGGRSDRITRVADDLRRNGYVRAGDDPLCIMTLNEAQRLQRAGVLVRRSIRTRDRGGRVYAIDPYFGDSR